MGRGAYSHTHAKNPPHQSCLWVFMCVCVQSAARESSWWQWWEVFLLQFSSDRNHHRAGSCWSPAAWTPVSAATGVTLTSLTSPLGSEPSTLSDRSDCDPTNQTRARLNTSLHARDSSGLLPPVNGFFFCFGGDGLKRRNKHLEI